MDLRGGRVDEKGMVDEGLRPPLKAMRLVVVGSRFADESSDGGFPPAKILNLDPPPAGPLNSLQEQLQTTLGDAYRLESELGGGGMSRVFVAPSEQWTPIRKPRGQVL